jgi:hypothetical protein
MRLRHRLVRLERTIRGTVPAPDAAPEEPRTDEEEADRVGEFLWAGLALDKQYPPRWGTGRALSGTEPLRAWRDAAEAAWAAGHRQYHTGLRPVALGVWHEWKPSVLKHRQTLGEWISTGAPVRAETITMEEFQALPLDERVAILRQHRPGYWSKIGSRSAIRGR